MNETTTEIEWEGSEKTGLMGHVPGSPLRRWWVDRILHGKCQDRKRYYLREWEGDTYSWDYVSDFNNIEDAIKTAQRMADNKKTPYDD